MTASDVVVAIPARDAASRLPGKPHSLVAHVLPAGRIGKNPLHWPKGIEAILEGRRMALRLFDSFQPSAVIGFGGYPAFPALWAASGAGIPSVIHEQNAVAGTANKWLARMARRVLSGFPGVLPKGEGVVDGWLDAERLQQVRAQLPALAHRVL